MIIDNGSYGKRMGKICEVAGIETVTVYTFNLKSTTCKCYSDRQMLSSLNIKGKSQEPLHPLMIIIIIITVILVKIMLNIVPNPKVIRHCTSI